MNKDIFLVSPPYGRAYGRAHRRIRHALPPLGLACINGVLKSSGYRTRFMDLVFADVPDKNLLDHLAADRPRFVGITASTTQIMSAVRIAQAVKEADPDVLTVLGGPHPSALPELTASYPGVDLVVSGEGEEPMLDLMKGKPYEKIPGLTWSHRGVIRSNPRPPPITDLDGLPLPDYEGLDTRRYGHILNGSSMPVMSGRGCPYHCVFCASGAVARRKCRFLSPARFVDHIEDLAARYGARDLVFTDETFVLRVDRARTICEEILRRRSRIRWVCQTRINGIAPDVVRIMKRAGCRMVEIGIESGDQRVLDSIGKGIVKEKIRQTCRIIKEAGIRLNGFFILGLPHDTPETIRRTIDFAKELPLDFAQFAMFVPLPGSEGWELALDGRVLRMYADDWDDFSRYSYPIVESDALGREQCKALHTSALREFYYRPQMMAEWLLSIDSGKTLKNLIQMVIAFAQVSRAKHRPADASQMPLITRDRVRQLIGPLGRKHEEATPDLQVELGPPRRRDRSEIPPYEVACPALAS